MANALTNAALPDVFRGKASLAQIVALQQAMLEELGDDATPGNTDSVCPVKHHFAPGMYAREMLIPAGFVLVGKMHRKDHLVTLAKGRIVVAGEDGTKEMTAPMTFMSKAGTKRAGYALEDTIWITYHCVDSQDLSVIEADVIVPEVEVLEMVRLEALA